MRSWVGLLWATVLAVEVVVEGSVLRDLRAIPNSGGMYGKRSGDDGEYPSFNDSPTLYFKRTQIPLSGALYGKRQIPLSGGVYGKRALPMNGGMYGKRSGVNTRAIPASGGLYGR